MSGQSGQQNTIMDWQAEAERQRRRAVVAEQQCARLEAVAAAARAAVSYQGGGTWPMVWLALEQALAALDGTETTETEGGQDG